MQGSINAEREHEASASLIAIFTTNQPMYDKLMSLKMNPNGEFARMIEFNIPKPKILKDDPSFGPKVFDEFNYNYGHAGIEFIKALMTYSDEQIKTMKDYWITKFKQDFGDDSVYRFYENMVGAVLTSGEICREHDIVNIDLDRLYDVILNAMVGIRAGVGKVNDVDYESLLGDFINQNQSSILSIKSGNVVMDPRGPLLIRSVIENNALMVSRPAFRKYLNDLQVSQGQFTLAMRKLGALIDEKKVRMGAGWKDATAEINTMCYIFDTTKFTIPVDAPIIDNEPA
jgi:hypothetical protein